MSTLAVRNEAQKILFDLELSGQISDGYWENAAPQDHWIPWCETTVIVDPTNVGRDFSVRKDNYGFTRRDLLDIVGDRMLEYVRAGGGEYANYSEADMLADLRDLKRIIKTRRDTTLPVPTEKEQLAAQMELARAEVARARDGVHLAERNMRQAMQKLDTLERRMARS